MNELIKYEQPTYDFSKVDEKVKEVTQELSKYNFDELVITEDNKSEIKKVRTKFGKEFKEFEDFRKQFKKNVMIPYDEFEKVYKPLSDLYKKADSDLKNGIAKIENQQINEVESWAKSYFTDLVNGSKVEFLNYEQANLVIKLSDSKKSRETLLQSFVNGVKSDVDTIDTLPNKERVRVAYEGNGLDLNKAITEVNLAIKREEEMKRLREEREELEQAKAEEVKPQEEKFMEQNIFNEEVHAPIVEEKLKITFTIEDTKENIIKVREFMRANGINYKGE